MAAPPHPAGPDPSSALLSAAGDLGRQGRVVPATPLAPAPLPQCWQVPALGLSHSPDAVAEMLLTLLSPWPTGPQPWSGTVCLLLAMNPLITSNPSLVTQKHPAFLGCTAAPCSEELHGGEDK